MNKILVVGSVNMDLILQTERLPAAGESRLGSQYSFALGGKGANQAVAAARLGAQTAFAGAVGDDVYGKTLADSLRGERIDTGRLAVLPNAPTGFAAILLEGSDNRILVYGGANMAVTAEDVLAALDDRPDAVLMQLEIPFPVVCAVAARAKERGVRLVLDMGPAREEDFSRICAAEIVSPNRTELTAATGLAADTPDRLAAALDKLAATIPCRYIVLKDGAAGAWLYDQGNLRRFPTYDVAPVVDTTGAGDAFTAAMTAHYIAHGDIAAAIDFGNAAGSLATTKLGAQNAMPTVEEVAALQAGGRYLTK